MVTEIRVTIGYSDSLLGGVRGSVKVNYLMTTRR